MGLRKLIRKTSWYKNYQAKKESKMSDEEYFIYRHKKIFGYTPDFKNPQTFNEKIIHRILFDRNPIYTALADKLKARIYIATILKDFNANNTLDSNKDANTLVSHTNHITHITTGGGGKYSLNQNNTESGNKFSQAIQNLESTQNTLQNPIPNQATQNLNSLLAKDSLLFQPIDTLTQELFNTNSCPYLPKLYGIYKSVDEIDFSKLPQSFVLKTNHDCGGVVLVKDKESFLKDSKSFSESMDKLTQHLNTNFYTMYREWHYKDIEPRIFAEEMLLETNANGEAKVPSDYKIHCFGKTQYIQVDTDRFVEHTRSVFDENWNLMPFSLCYPQSTMPPSKPLNFMVMLTIATRLSMPFAMLRVDLYNIQGKIIVGELTFTHGGGTEKFTPNEWDKKLGGLWKLS